MKIKTSPELSPLLEKVLLRQCGFEHLPERSHKELRRLAGAVRAISDRYVAAESGDPGAIFKDRHLLEAYVLYYLPVNFVKLYPILDELLSVAGVSFMNERSVSLLDLGCGPGTYLLAFLEYVARNRAFFDAVASIDCVGIDQSRENLDMASRLFHDCIASGVSPAGVACEALFRQASLLSRQCSRALRTRPAGFNLVVAGNVITELHGEDLQNLLREIEACMAPGAALVIIDPGTKKSSRQLLAVRDAVLQATSLHLCAPCLQSGPCPLGAKDNEWCHEKMFWKPPGMVKAVDAVLPFTKERGIKYSYLTFTRQSLSRLSLYTDCAPETVWRVVSYLIRNRGEERLHVCNGCRRVLLRRLLKNASDSNADFSSAQRGDIICLDKHGQRDQFLDICQDSIFRIL